MIRGSNPNRGNIFYLLQNVNTGSGADPASNSVGPFLGIKRPGRDVDYLPSVEVKNGWSCTCPPIYLHGADRDICNVFDCPSATQKRETGK